jgi:hypothetical protein
MGNFIERGKNGRIGVAKNIFSGDCFLHLVKKLLVAMFAESVVNKGIEAIAVGCCQELL